ncbi:MAG: TonB-dependent receptor plug domain-containing protein, partial [Candidatus Binatia bacterium]|nr:TonB-dependent receptor plug domain-containing protein [Candidatus Binatia bacterium]
MKKILPFVFLVLILILPFADTGAQPEETLPPVVVTSTRLKNIGEDVNRIAGKVIVISRESIQKLGAKTIQEVLQHQSGIVLYDLIGNEFQSTVDIRGFNGQPVPGTTVFLDGVRVNEPDFNTINFDLIPIENIKKIEIHYGPGTVFGRNSLAGVINIETKRGRKDRPHFGLELGGGSY